MHQNEPPVRKKEATRRASPQTRRGQPTVITHVPERPALAPNVQLVGEMQGTGYKDQQWLIQRGERFIQLTELLYRVAEHSDGERALKEIAARVTECTDWMVSADNVRQIIQVKLIPMGLIASADGSLVLHDKDRGPSPLRINMRTRVLGPRFIDPIARVLQDLYWPPILVPVLALIAFAHGWLYFTHGVISSVYEVIYRPGLFLLVLAVLLMASVFHEFGHASALRYGGGSARGMGVGLYLIYPAFYTDTTDSYRLGRWARVRTDLGGFYFHLIFAVVLMALYLASGQEFLLLGVLLINLDIVRQCLPFVRFDGYWTLADLTGIPDFFSQMGAFLRSVLPLRRWKGTKLPNLKPWVKATFALYTVITVPVLALLLFLLVTRLPGIAAAIWDSLLIQARGLSHALGAGDILGVALSGTQAFILMLQMLAISYLLYALGRKIFGITWRRVASIHRAA